MVQVSYPGVYIEEVPSGVHTITGVATSIAAFFGRTAKGPINKAVRCLSMSDFDRAFAGPHPRSDLAQSVRQFFDNGGTDCYVVRLAAGANAASITLTDISGGMNPNILIATAKTPGLWGNGLHLEVDYNTPNPDESFNLTVIQMDAGEEVIREPHLSLSMDPQSPRFAPDYVTQSSALIDLEIHEDVHPAGPSGAGPRDLSDPLNYSPGFSQSRAFNTSSLDDFHSVFSVILEETPNLKISVDEEPDKDIDLSSVLDLINTESTLSEIATQLTSVINEQLDESSVNCEWITLTSGSVSALRITANSGLNRSVRIHRATERDFAVPMMMGIDQGGIEVTGHSQFRPVPTGAFYQYPEKLIDLSNLTLDQITSIQIDTDDPIVLGFSSLSTGDDDFWFEQSGGGVDGVREKLRAIVQAVNNSEISNWKAEVWGYHLAFFYKNRDASVNLIPSDITSVTDDLSGTTTPNFTRNIRQYSLGMTGTSSFQKIPVIEDKGDDGSAPQFNEFIGNEEEQTGFHALDSVDLFNLMVIPDDDEIPETVHRTLWGPASIYCEKHRAFLLMDAPPSWTSNGRPDVVKDAALKVTELRSGIAKDYSAVFYPRLLYINNVGLRKSIGSAGAIAGLMSRIDSTRGVWKAPAGTEADIRGIVGLEVKLTDMENGVLNKVAVNCIRAFPGGYVNWGARTMSGSDSDTSEWKYISIRRLALFLEESLYRGTKWVVFEPNDEPLWAKIRLNLGAFMMRLFKQGAFQGSTPDKAFYVKCDGETTTQADRNLGIVNIEVGFAPLKPAEFVIIRIQQIAGEL